LKSKRETLAQFRRRPPRSGIRDLRGRPRAADAGAGLSIAPENGRYRFDPELHDPGSRDSTPAAELDHRRPRGLAQGFQSENRRRRTGLL
jgi:hypothetical protein